MSSTPAHGAATGDRGPPWPHAAQGVLSSLSRGRAALEASHASVAMTTLGRSNGAAHASGSGVPDTESLQAPEWSVMSASPARPRVAAFQHLEHENARLRGDLEWRAKDQMRVEADLLKVMAEWREKVAALEDRLEHMTQHHREEKRELEAKMRGMYSADVVGKYHAELARLQRDLANALNLRESALSDDLDARDTVIKELGAHLRTAHENNQRMHLELQEMQARHHEELARARAREAQLQQRVEELQEAHHGGDGPESMASPERQHLQQMNQELSRELAQAHRRLQDCCTEKDRVKRESEWAVSKMTAELQRAQHALGLFDAEMREGRATKNETLRQLEQLHEAQTRRLSADLDAETQRAAVLEQRLEACMHELKRKSTDVDDLQVSLATASSRSSHALSADDTMLASSPSRRGPTGLSTPASPTRSALLLELQQQQHSRQSAQEHSGMVAQVSALRNSLAAMEREKIELSSAVDVQKSRERVLTESLQNRDGKISMLQGEIERLEDQLSRCKEHERRAVRDHKEFKLRMEDERVRLLHTITDLEQERETAMLTRGETSCAAETHSKLAELKDTELRALQAEHDRAVSAWRAAKLDYTTKLAESNARAATAQEAILLLEADLEMKNKLLDQVVESSGEGNETLNIYVTSLHHAGLIAKALDARNKELRQKIGESEQYRLTGTCPLSPKWAHLNYFSEPDTPPDSSFQHGLHCLQPGL